MPPPSFFQNIIRSCLTLTSASLSELCRQTERSRSLRLSFIINFLFFITIQSSYSQTPTVTAGADGYVDPLCPGSSDGSINVTVIPGTGPYTFHWTGPNGFTANTEDLTGLAAGAYNLTIDDNGTTDDDHAYVAVTLTDPDPIILSLTPYNTSLTGASDGSIISNASGGTGALSYLWSDQQTAQDALYLVAGNYSLTVTDANGCSTTQSTTVNEPGVPLAVQLTSPVNSMGYHVTCGANNGTITSNTIGGNAPYTFLWYPNGQTTPNLSGLDAGLYKVIVTDANGGVTNAEITLTKQNPCYWGISGNSATNSFVNFLGTTDTAYLAFRTSNIENMRISKEGRVGIGTTLPEKALHVYTHHTNAGIEIERAPDNELGISDKYQLITAPDGPVGILRQSKFDANGTAISGTASGFGVVSGTGVTQIPCCNDFSNGVSQGIRLEDFETVGNSSTTSRWDIEPLVTSAGGHLLGLSHIGTSASRVLTLTDKSFVGVNVELPVTDFQVNRYRAVTLGQMSDGTNHLLTNGEYIGFNSYLVKSGSDMKMVKMTSPSTAPQTGGAVIAADKEGNLHFQMYNANLNSQSVTGYVPQITFTTAGGITTPAGPLGMGWLDTPPTSTICPGMYTDDCIGIGTNNPVAKLDVHGKVKLTPGTLELWTSENWKVGLEMDAGNVIRMSSASISSYKWYGFGATDGGWYWITADGPASNSQSKYPMKLHFDNCGMPLLTVSNAGWCDFVFDENYKPQSLSEIEEYIKPNKHLPGIPSEKEINEKGLSINSMQKLQMEKIEDIYLYLFDLKKENEKLRKEIDALRNK